MCQRRAHLYNVHLWLFPLPDSSQFRPGGRPRPMDRDGKTSGPSLFFESATDCSNSNLDPSHEIRCRRRAGKSFGGVDDPIRTGCRRQGQHIWVRAARDINPCKGHTHTTSEVQFRTASSDTSGQAGVAGARKTPSGEPSLHLVAPTALSSSRRHGGPKGNNRIVEVLPGREVHQGVGQEGWGPGSFNRSSQSLHGFRRSSLFLADRGHTASRCSNRTEVSPGVEAVFGRPTACSSTERHALRGATIPRTRPTRPTGRASGSQRS